MKIKGEKESTEGRPGMNLKIRWIRGTLRDQLKSD
jgi:hypothetical protein